MLLNLILLIGILLFFAYAIYDQFLMPKRHGETQIAVALKRQGKADGIIFIALILIALAQSFQKQIEPLTLYLLSFCIILAVYAVFVRCPKLLLKPQGFFLGNLYVDYRKIRQINLAQDKKAQKVLVIDLTNGKRLFVLCQQAQDLERIVTFFGGYKPQ